MNLLPLEPAKKYDYRLWALVILVFLIGITIYKLVQTDILKLSNENTLSDDTSSQFTATVTEQPFIYTMAAYGRLKSVGSRSIVNQVEGRIVDLHHSMENTVQSTTRLVLLENPRITQRLSLATQERLLAEAESLSLESELLDQRALLAFEYSQSQGELKLAESELQAMTELFKRKIVSKFDFQRQQLLSENARLKTNLLQQRIKSFRQVTTFKVKTAKLKLQQAQVAENTAQRDVSLLSVTSEIEGVLQVFDDELKVGDWLPIGSKLATVADTRGLHAELFINASDILYTRIGQAVALNIKGMPGRGTVQRIAPRVENNQVKIDVALTGALPSTALPFVEVNADIVAIVKENVLQVNKPDYFMVNNNIAKLYAKAPNASEFKWVDVEIGLLANDKIEIISGLTPGTTVALQQPQA